MYLLLTPTSVWEQDLWKNRAAYQFPEPLGSLRQLCSLETMKGIGWVGLNRGRDGQPLRIRDPGLVKTGDFQRGSETHKCGGTARSPVHLRPSCSQRVMGPDYLKNFGPFYHHGGTQDLTLICHMRLDNFAKLQLRLSRIMALIHHAARNCSPPSHHHPGS